MIGFFLNTVIGRALASGAVILTAWVAFAWHYESKGQAKAVAQFQANGERNAQKASAARRTVDRISDERLRDPYFRD